MAGDHLELEGVVVGEEAGGHFRVTMAGTDKSVLAKLSGRMREKRIRVILGDSVRVRFSPYDLERGQIIYRNR